jgi:hypothetical protein
MREVVFKLGNGTQEEARLRTGNVGKSECYGTEEHDGSAGKGVRYIVKGRYSEWWRGGQDKTRVMEKRERRPR